MASFHFKPGDIVENLHASRQNPLRVSVVIKVTQGTIYTATLTGHTADYSNRKGSGNTPDWIVDWLIKRGEISIPEIELTTDTQAA